MSDFDQEDSKFADPCLPLSPQPIDTSVNLSSFKDQYLKQMSFSHPQLMRDHLLKKLKKKKICEWSMENDQQISIHKINSSKYCEIVEVGINFGWLMLRIKIINIQGESPTHSCDQFDGGSFGKIYRVQLGNKTKAIKCFQVNMRHQIESYLVDAIVQYGFLKIASAIQCGPEINTEGFDIYVYKTEIMSKQENQIEKRYCIQFQTELCASQMEFEQLDCKQLYKSLFCLHQLNIAHCDIKLDNIMYSHAFQKWVFIDFGVSAALKEEIGQRTKTKFRGTLKYSGQEMKRLYSSMYDSKAPIFEDYVDLYWNDVFSLNIACLDLERRNKLSNRVNQLIPSLIRQKRNTQIEQHFFIINFKYCLYFGSESSQQQFVDSIKWKKQNRLSMMYFLFELQYIPEKVRIIFTDFLKAHEMESMELTILTSILSQVKSTLNYNQQTINRFQLQMRPKTKFFKEIPQSLHRAQSYSKMQQERSFKEEKIDNVYYYLINYKNPAKKQQLHSYYSILFEAVSFITNKHVLTFDDKVEACKVFYRLTSNDPKRDEKQGLDYIKYFISKAMNICLKPQASPLKTYFFQIYQNFLMLGLFSLPIIKQIYAVMLSQSKNISKICENFLKLYNLNFWIDQQIFAQLGFDYVHFKQYLLSEMYRIYQMLQPDNILHKNCDKSLQVCWQMQRQMLRRIQEETLIKKSQYIYHCHTLEQRLQKCSQAIYLSKIAYHEYEDHKFKLKEIPRILKSLYIEELYMLHTESWARITYLIREFINCDRITDRWGFICKMKFFYNFNAKKSSTFFKRLEDEMSKLSIQKNHQKMKQYYEIIVHEIYSQEKSMNFLQNIRDKLIEEGKTVFIEQGNLYSEQQLATLLFKFSESQSRFIWYYLGIINLDQSDRVLNILRLFSSKLTSESCCIKKQQKMLKLSQFAIRHQISLPNVSLLNAQTIIQYPQEKQMLLYIKLKFIEERILNQSNLKNHYLWKLYQIVQRNNRYIDYFLKNIYYTVFIDLITLLITSSRIKEALHVIYKINQNLNCLLSKSTIILSKKTINLLYDVFIIKRSDNFIYWQSFRDQFVKKYFESNNKNVFIFLNLTIALIDKSAYEFSHPTDGSTTPNLVLPQNFNFIDCRLLKRLLLDYTKLLTFTLPIFQVYEIEYYYQLVVYLELRQRQGLVVNNRRYKKIIKFHFKSILRTLPIELQTVRATKKYQYLQMKEYQIIINIYRWAWNYKEIVESQAKLMFKQKINRLIDPYQGIIHTKVKFPK